MRHVKWESAIKISNFLAMKYTDLHRRDVYEVLAGTPGFDRGLLARMPSTDATVAAAANLFTDPAQREAVIREFARRMLVIVIHDREFPTHGKSYYVGSDGGALAGEEGVEIGREWNENGGGKVVLQRDDGSMFTCGGAWLNESGKHEQHIFEPIS